MVFFEKKTWCEERLTRLPMGLCPKPRNFLGMAPVDQSPVEHLGDEEVSLLSTFFVSSQADTISNHSI
jgi:hypothetical protein